MKRSLRLHNYLKTFLFLAIFCFNAQMSFGQVNITPIRTDVAGFSAWTDNAVAGSTYVQLLTASSSTISPAMNFDGFTNETLNFKARTFGGSTAAEIILTVSISTDNGDSWTVLGTRTPSNSTLNDQTPFILSSYNGTQVKIRFTVGGTSNTVGVGIDDISITGNVISSGPEINLKYNTTSILDGATPASIPNGTDYGTVATNTDVTRTFTIENTGSTDLVLTAPYVQKSLSTSVFTITQPSLTTIPTGQSTTFSVTFNSAVAGTFDEVIEVLSNDSDEAVYNFAIKAISEIPVSNIIVKGNNIVITVGDTTPSALDNTDFGSAATNSNIVKTFTIENSGTGDLIVDDILMSNAPTSSYVIGGISFPSTIVSNSSTTFTVTFNSALAGTFNDSVLISNNDPTDSTFDFAVTAKAAVLNFSVGDISITALANDAPDGISFVNWVPIPVDAELSLTDNAWNGTSLLLNEETMVWKNNTGNVIPVGTVIYINTVTPSTDLGSVTGVLSGLSTSSENVFIYEGSAASPFFIYGLSNLNWINSGTVTTNNSYLPTALNVVNGNIVTGDFDNVEYSGALAPKDEKSSFSAYKLLVNNPANWTKNNTPFALNSVDFELAAVWETSAWTDGLTPTSLLKTVINDVYTTSANSAFSSKKLTVTTNGNLTINSGTNITVQDEVINNGTLTVESNANLVQVNNVANTGNIAVKRDTNPLMRFDYVMWSTPVDGTQKLLDFSPLTSVSPTIRFYNYDSANNVYTSVSSPSTTEFVNATGYLIRLPFNHPTAPVAWTGTFSGVPNNGPISLSSLTSGLFYATGNPYPSTIDADDFILTNGLTDALYFWRKTNGASGSAYATYTLAGGTAPSPGTLASPSSAIPNGTIQVGQGFIAKATSTSLAFDNTMRSTPNNDNQTFKSASSELPTTVERNRFWLNLSDATQTIGQTMVSYMTGATNGLDAQIDGKYINDSATALTSLIEGQEYAIQGKTLPFTATDVVPLGFKTETAGDYSISIFDKDGLFANNGQIIYLRDNLTNSIQNLNSGAYNFTSQVGVFNGRFDVIYQNALSTDVVDFTSNNVSIYNQNNVLNINSGNNTMSTVKVYDVLGRLLAQSNKINASQTQINIPATNQALIVQITSSEGIVVVKKVAN
ncbi:choice-of-anchor D domain-containing protein [Flavobacterium aquatile]|nr:choice-of-anchor D domain-containing protein [Flavobacterium aquatile]